MPSPAPQEVGAPPRNVRDWKWTVAGAQGVGEGQGLESVSQQSILD